MKRYDFRRFEELYAEWEAQFTADTDVGSFRYRVSGPVSLYGTADMLISRATMGALDLTEEQKDRWAAVINGFQVPRSGWYRKRYTLHFRSHTAAYAVAALKLIDRGPTYPVRAALDVVRDRTAAVRWLERVPWSIIWPSSHIVAGLPAILIMMEAPAGAFFDWYFDWLDTHVHPATGFWSRGVLQRLKLRPIVTKEELGGAFHMHFVYEALGRAWPLPNKVVDTALALQHPNGLWDGDVSYCIDLDGLYCLIRSSRNAGGYRADDVRVAAERYLAYAEKTLNDREFLFARYDTSHRLTGALSAVAECARAYPELVETSRPWRQTLDSACFI